MISLWCHMIKYSTYWTDMIKYIELWIYICVRVCMCVCVCVCVCVCLWCRKFIYLWKLNINSIILLPVLIWFQATYSPSKRIPSNSLLLSKHRYGSIIYQVTSRYNQLKKKCINWFEKISMSRGIRGKLQNMRKKHSNGRTNLKTISVKYIFPNDL